jgi:hypothetical protein
VPVDPCDDCAAASDGVGSSSSSAVFADCAGDFPSIVESVLGLGSGVSMPQIGPRIPVMPTPLYYLASMADAMQGAPWLSAPASLFDCPCMANSSVHACVRLQALCRHTLAHCRSVSCWILQVSRPSSAIALWSLLLPLWERYGRWLDLVTARQHAPTHNACRSPEWMHMHPTPPHPTCTLMSGPQNSHFPSLAPSIVLCRSPPCLCNRLVVSLTTSVGALQALARPGHCTLWSAGCKGGSGKAAG